MPELQFFSLMLSGLYHHIKRGTAAGDEQHDRVVAALADRPLKVGHAGDLAAVHLLDHVAAAQARFGCHAS